MKDSSIVEKTLLRTLFSFGDAEVYNVVDDDGIRKSVVKTHHQETLDEAPEGNKERYVVDIDWRLFDRWFGKDEGEGV